MVIILPVYGTVHTAYIVHTCFNRSVEASAARVRRMYRSSTPAPSNIVNGTSCGFRVKFQYSGRRSTTRPPAITYIGGGDRSRAGVGGERWVAREVSE
eukprot:COSAG01_NODE_1241_length_11085_cov_9.712361_2_plen_98_part_00